MPVNEQFVRWTGALSDVVTVFNQDIRIDMNMEANEPLGGLHIHAAAFAGTPVYLPNSTNASPAWDTIPGTNPVLQVRQDGHYPTDLIKIRQSNTFTNLTTVHASITLGASPAGTRIEQSGDVVRMRGFIQATGAIASGLVLARVAHPPLHAVSTGVRYTAGSNRLQVGTNGDVSLTASLALNDQVWLDGVTYDLLA